MDATPDRQAADTATAPPPPRGSRVVRIGLILVTAVVLVDAVVGDKGVFALVRQRENHRQVTAELAAQRQDNQRMVDQARRYREDSATIEDLARRDLGMIKPGEKLFIIRDREHAPAPEPAR
jgi:cell division protein FtsB